MLDAAGETGAPELNRAILLVLLDTGLRVSELCSLRVGDVSWTSTEIVVTGKGGKQRSIYLGTVARRTVRRYLLRCRPEAGAAAPLFVSEGGQVPGTAFTSNGVRLMKQWGRAGQVQGVRCSPHTLRHTFAIQFLRSGGNLFELQKLMGHADLTILRRYVALAEQYLAQAHRQASPVDRMKLR